MNLPQPSTQKNLPRPSGNSRSSNTYRVSNTQASSQDEQKRPSYLNETKQAFFQLYTDITGQSGTSIDDLLEQLWKFISPKLAQSYWNGVSAGASGRVKPKADKPQAGKTYRASGGQA